MWQQLVAPQVVNDYAGMCLRFTQSVFGAPVKYRSAWDAWNATQLKHSVNEPLPDVSVIIWMSHWGTYGSPPSYENWGHVVTWFPTENKFLSSPGSEYGHQWFDSIRAVESYFKATYVGWSEDINGLQVASFTDTPKKFGINKMRVVLAGTNYYLIGPSFCAIAPDSEAVRVWKDMWGAEVPIYSAHDLNRATWALGIPAGVIETLTNEFAGRFGVWDYQRGFIVGSDGSAGNPSSIADNVVNRLDDVEVNVDGIAQAVADKIECNCSCGVAVPENDVTTKADIIEAIELNYPEDV